MTNNKLIHKLIRLFAISKILQTLILFIIILSAILPLMKYFALNTNYYDLGISDHYLFINTAYNNWYFFIKSHFSPIFFFYSLIYDVISTPYVLLILQYMAVTFSAYLIYKISITTLNKKISLLFTAIYMIHPMYLYQIFWDFHVDHLFLPILIFIFYITEGVSTLNHLKKNILLIILIILLMSIKENSLITAMFLSIYLFIKKEYKIGFFTLLSSILVYYIASSYIGYYNKEYHIDYIYEFVIGENSIFPSFYHIWGNSYGELIKNVLLHPIDTIFFIIYDKTRAIFMIILFFPLLITSILVPRFLIVAIPGLAMILLANSYEKATMFHHYHASVFPIIFVASIFGFQKLQKRFFYLSKMYLAILSISVCFYSFLYAPMPWGRFFYWNEINNYGYEKYIPTQRIEQIKILLNDKYIRDRDIKISFQNNMYTSIIGHRKHLEIFPKISNSSKFAIVDSKKILPSKKAEYNKLKWLKENWTIYKQYDGFYIFINPSIPLDLL